MGAVSALWVFFAEFTYKSAVSASKADGAFRAAVALLRTWSRRRRLGLLRLRPRPARPLHPTSASPRAVLSTVLAVMMGLRFRDSGKVFPAGVVALLSVGMTLLYASRAFTAFDQGAGIKKD